MASLKNPIKMRSDITECPGCAEFMVEPTMLPCFHSFCLECLALCLCKRNSGESALCPLCGAMFQIPNDGVDSLPRNIFIQKLIEAKTSPTSTDFEKKCDICSGQGITNIAHKFCIECQQNMCVQCSQGHKFITSTKLHEVLTLEDQTETTHMLKLSENNHCEKHEEEKLKIYCIDCKAVVCTKCFLHCHTKHGGSYIMEVVAEMKKKVITNIGEINVLSKRVHSELEKLDTEFEHLHAAVVKTEKQILEQGEAVKRRIDTHVQDLISKLRFEESHGVKMMENIKEDMILQKIRFDSYTNYVTEVMQKGTPTYIASVAEELRTGAGDLKICEIVSMTNPFEVTFKPSDMKEIIPSGTSIIGEINISQHPIFAPIKPAFDMVIPKLVNKMNFDSTVRGMVVVGQDLYVITDRICDVLIFDADTHQSKSKIPLEGSHPWSITAIDNTLFISEFNSSTIRCIALSEHTVSLWQINTPTSKTFARLSGTKQGYLLVTLSQLNELHEYTPTGSLQRTIQLQPEMRGLRDAIHVDNDCFLITHDAKDLSRVCLVACNGNLITSYGGSPGSGLGQLDGPHYLALASDGFVFVSCCNGNRVVLLNKDLEFVSDIIPTTAGMKKICTIYFDEHHEHLYVSNFIENTLSVFWLD